MSLPLSLCNAIRAATRRWPQTGLRYQTGITSGQWPEGRRHYSTDIKQRIEEMVKKDPVVVFMKGVPDMPKCGFSNAVAQILRMHGVQYQSHDVLEDESLRQGIKEYSNWPTIPQIYIGGEFVGGCDILLQMHRNSELIDTLEKVGIKSALIDKQSSS